MLLILAGVAISLTVNSEGLIGKAKNAAGEWNNRTKEEQNSIENLLGYLGIESGGTQNLPAGWDEKKIESVFTETSTERTVPIPKGFVVSGITSEMNPEHPENTIEGGLVIYQKGNDETINWEANTITKAGEEPKNLQETANQYVWIPVDDINSMVMCKRNAENITDVCTIELVEGKLECTTHSNSNLCGRMYDVDWNEEYPESTVLVVSQNFDRRDQDCSFSYEPEQLFEDLNEYPSMIEYDPLLTHMTNAFMNMAKSIYIYKGFYVSRYENGKRTELNPFAQSVKNGTVLVNGNISAQGSNSSNYTTTNKSGWYGIYENLRVDTGYSVWSHMIWNSAYDQVIRFIGNDAQIAHEYQNDTQEKTGNNTSDILKNIYDLEGNNMEWTAGAGADEGRIIRGGSYFSMSEMDMFAPAAFSGRISPTENTDVPCCSRALLCISINDENLGYGEKIRKK